jgi:hypothetical protein
MTPNTTGRTVGDFVKLLLSDGSQMRSMPFYPSSLGDLGLDYPEEDLFAALDVIHGALVGKPSFFLEWDGPFDINANGAHVTLNALLGVMTPRSFDVQIGMRHDWESTEPQFGMTATATSGIIVTKYTVKGKDYHARIAMYAGSAVLPAWGAAAEAVS